ncbi:predicted protein [Postia placenta Mad-698-R]|nr:predicted protein [Postia placenta Mad-698-R]
MIHVHKRYSAFAELYARLRATLPVSTVVEVAKYTRLYLVVTSQEDQHHSVPHLPPKTPWAKFRPTFLDHRRRLLQHWLSAVLLHPEIGGCQAIREVKTDENARDWCCDQTTEAAGGDGGRAAPDLSSAAVYRGLVAASVGRYALVTRSHTCAGYKAWLLSIFCGLRLPCVQRRRLCFIIEPVIKDMQREGGMKLGDVCLSLLLMRIYQQLQYDT